MHRFRKKSDAKRAQVPEYLIAENNSRSPGSAAPSNSSNSLPGLPPVTDFRTSLILPVLSRRFTLLRTSTGDPVSLDDVRTKFAEQRRRGVEHQIFEEEEDMIVDALAQLRPSNGSPAIPSASSNTTTTLPPGGTSLVQQESFMNLSLGDSDYQHSFASGISPSVSSTVSPTYSRVSPSFPAAPRIPGSSPRYTSKRVSNNMFSSGSLHDTSYLRSVSKNVQGTRSMTTAGNDLHGGSARRMRPTRGTEVSPMISERDVVGDSLLSSESSTSQAASLTPHSIASTVSSRLPRDLTPQQIRTSLALDEVLRGFEEEAEETIVVPRTSSSRAGMVNSTQSSKPSETPSAVGTPIPWMTEEAQVDDRDGDDEPTPLITSSSQHGPVTMSPSSSPNPYHRSGTTSPASRLPGYIPGMTRPLTPRDMDSDKEDGTGYSTTPRARSPAPPQFSLHSNIPNSFSSPRHHRNTSVSSDGQSILPPSILRRGSGQQAPLRTTSPGYGGRSRGNSAAGPQMPSPAPSPAPEDRFRGDGLSRPLGSTQATVTYNGGSRPGTPSSPGPWTPSSPLAQVHHVSSHENDSSRPSTPGTSRNGSLAGPNSVPQEASLVTVSPGGDDPAIITGRQGSNAGALPAYGWEAQNRNGDMINGNGAEEPRQSAVAAKIAARAPTPVHTHSRTPSVSESGHEPLLLNRSVNRRVQRRIQSLTPPPQLQAQSPLALNTPSSSSNSSNLNVNASMYSGASPLFSPMLNTSASSLVSVGSSYHSWADEKSKRSRWDQLTEYDSQRSAWQELVAAGGNGLNQTDDTSETIVNPDKELQSLIGLTKGDLVVVQSKLVADAQARRGFDPPRSPTRRRRMSSSRASFSAAQSGRESGTNSPAPPPRQPTPVTENGNASPTTRYSPEDTFRANALLDSVLNSIQSQAASSSTVTSSDVPTVEPASTTTDDNSSNRIPSNSSLPSSSSRDDDSSALRLKALADALSVSDQPGQTSSNHTPPSSAPARDVSQSPEEDSGEATEVPASHPWRNPQLVSQRSPSEAVQLVQDVSQKAAAATAALKSPSLTNVPESDASMRRRTLRRIDLQKISSPHLVSSSLSVDAMPIAQAQGSSSAPSMKLSQRFKILRGTLRTKPSAPNGDEVLSSPRSSTQSPPSTSYNLQRLPSPQGPTQTLYHPSQPSTVPFSAIDQGNFKVPIPPPPASAGPGLKNFLLGRFRKSKKESEAPQVYRSEHRSSESTSPVPPIVDHRRQVSTGPSHSSSISRSRPSQDSVPPEVERTRSPTPDPATVNQLFNAALQLGVDQNELNELLARSTSLSSRKSNWDQPSGTGSVRFPRRTPSTREGRSFDRPRTPDQVVYKPQRRPTLVNRSPEGEVVRRTIIFANDNPSVSELDALVRKISISGRQQPSESSASLHSGASGSQPPMPKIPVAGASSKAGNPTDQGSFYNNHSQDAGFAGEQNGTSKTMSPAPGENLASNLQPVEQGQGPALEVLELSNGQVIWSVLDTLRAEEEDDSESFFRRSMASSRGNDEDLEVRFKEHRRWSSKGSNHSQVSQSPRRRPALVAGGPRPETKLFKTHSSTIGRLIEDLSKNLDSGSFSVTNTPPQTSTAPSASTSFHSDASGHVERELDALLKSMNQR